MKLIKSRFGAEFDFFYKMMSELDLIKDESPPAP